MKPQNLPTMDELSNLICCSLKGIIPEEQINVYASHNYESGEVKFNLQIRYPSMSALCPSRDVATTETALCPVRSSI